MRTMPTKFHINLRISSQFWLTTTRSSEVTACPASHSRTSRLAVAADFTFTPDEFAARRHEILPGGADIVVDAVGSVLGPAIEAAAMGGRIIVFGMNGAARPPIHQVEITEKGLSILGSYISNFTFPAAIRLVESGTLNLAPIVSAVLPLSEVLDGVARLRSGQATKIIITP